MSGIPLLYATTGAVGLLYDAYAVHDFLVLCRYWRGCTVIASRFTPIESVAFSRACPRDACLPTRRYRVVAVSPRSLSGSATCTACSAMKVSSHSRFGIGSGGN
jgi:hypothetical protein